MLVGTSIAMGVSNLLTLSTLKGQVHEFLMMKKKKKGTLSSENSSENVSTLYENGC
jgi:hypothetical protein